MARQKLTDDDLNTVRYALTFCAGHLASLPLPNTSSERARAEALRADRQERIARCNDVLAKLDRAAEIIEVALAVGIDRRGERTAKR